MVPAFLILLAYLVGAIPFGLLIGLARGIDVRKAGSGNIGATNVGRLLGKKWGTLCLTFDLLKGFVPTFLFGWYQVTGDPPSTTDQLLWLAIGLAAVLGHVFPVYLGFKGGKGVATTIGVGLAVYPLLTIPMVCGLVAFAAGRYGTGMTSLGSILLGIMFPLALVGYSTWRGWQLSLVWPCLLVTTILGLLILVRHRANIGRILRGTEPRGGKSAQT